MNTKLEPCPFCGEDATTSKDQIPLERLPYGWGWVGCQKCRVFISWSNGDRGKAMAIDKWNTRVVKAERK